MTDLCRVNVSWQNWPGAPGLSQFYFLNAAMQTNVDAVRTFFNSFTAILPSGLTITVPGSGDIIDSASGSITSAWSVTTPPAVVTAIGSGAYAGNAGAVIHWLTNDVSNGRRVRGRTFLVPLVSSSYEANGSLVAATITTITNAGNALRTTAAGNMRVYSRPVTAHTEYNRKTGQATTIASRPGQHSDVSAVRVPDLAVSLRSRRI